MRAGTHLAGDGSIHQDAPVAEGDEPKVNNGGDPVMKDPSEVVHDEPRAERAQSLVIDRHRDSPCRACWEEAEQNEERNEGKTK